MLNLIVPQDIGYIKKCCFFQYSLCATILSQLFVHKSIENFKLYNGQKPMAHEKTTTPHKKVTRPHKKKILKQND